MSGDATEEPLYVYGVVPAAEAARWPEVEGLDGPSTRVRLVERGALAALVSTIPVDKTPGTRADLEAHQRVLAAAVEHGTVVPMRFGVVMDGEETVRDVLLSRHEAQLEALLQKLAGHVQMAVKAYYVGDALVRAVVASRPELARRSAELQRLPEARSYGARVQLGEEVAALAAAARERDESALLDKLAPLAAEIATEPAADERVALNAQLLVHRERRGKLDEAIAKLRAELEGRVAFRYVGPIPPYSFADIALEDATWA
jgi:Gas vesicle synthesis protein GvpL/GvpF